MENNVSKEARETKERMRVGSHKSITDFIYLACAVALSVFLLYLGFNPRMYGWWTVLLVGGGATAACAATILFQKAMTNIIRRR